MTVYRSRCVLALAPNEVREIFRGPRLGRRQSLMRRALSPATHTRASGTTRVHFMHSRIYLKA